MLKGYIVRERLGNPVIEECLFLQGLTDAYVNDFCVNSIF